MYFNGQGIPEDKEEAVKCYENAAKLGQYDSLNISTGSLARFHQKWLWEILHFYNFS